MTTKEILDSEGNVVITLVEAENSLEEEVAQLLCSIAYAIEKHRNPDAMKDFSGFVRIAVVEGKVTPIFIANEGIITDGTEETDSGNSELAGDSKADSEGAGER